MSRISAACLIVASAFVCLIQPAHADDVAQAIQFEDPQLGRAADFYQDVYPILERKCLACHSASKRESDLVLETAAGLLQGGASGPAVVAGNPDGSLLYQLCSRAMAPSMPPLPNSASAQPVTGRELGIVRQWITEGANAGTRPAAAGELAWQPLPENIHSIYSVALSRDERFVATGRSNRISIYDLSNQTEIALTDSALLSLEYQGTRFYGPGTSHRDFVHSLEFSPNGRWLASAGYREVKLWERQPVETRFNFDGGSPITSLALSEDGTLAVTGHEDMRVRVWSLTTGQIAVTLEGHLTPVRAVDISADGTEILSAGDDGIIRRSKVTGEFIAELPTGSAVRAILLSRDATLVMTGHDDAVIRAWTKPEPPAPVEPPPADAPPPDPNAPPAEAVPPAPPMPVREMRGHGAAVTSLLRFPENEEIVSGSADGNIFIWNITNGGQVRQFNVGGAVAGIAVSADGQWVAAGGAGNIARVWKRADGQQRIEVKGDPRSDLNVVALTDEQAVAASLVSLADTEKTAAATDVTSREENLTKSNEAVTAAQTAVTDAQTKLNEAVTAFQQAVAQREEAERQVTAAQDQVNLTTTQLNDAKNLLAADPMNEGLKQQVATLEQTLVTLTQTLDQAKPVLEQMKTNEATANTAKKTAEDNLTAAQNMLTSAQRAVELGTQGLANARTKVETTTQLHAQAQTYAQQVEQQLTDARNAAQMTQRPISAVAFSADGRQLITTGDDNNIYFWNAESGASLETLPGEPARVSALRSTPTGLMLSVAGNMLQVRDPRPVWKLAGVLGANPGNSLDVTASPMVGRVLSVAFSPDSTTLATGGGDPSRSGELILWSVDSRQPVRVFTEAHSDTVFDIEFSRDGKYLASASADKFMKVFELAGGTLVRAFEGHTGHVLAVAWKGDGSTLATGGADNVIKVWTFLTGEQVRTITTHTKQVTDVDYVGVTDNIVSCSGGKDVRYHQASNGRFYREFSGNTDYVYAAESNRSEKLVVAGGQDGVLRVWNGENSQLLMSFDPPLSAEEAATASLNP